MPVSRCESNQEVFDTTLQSFYIAEKLMLPVMLILDAFFLSHTSEIVDIFDGEEGAKYLEPYDPLDYLTPDKPKAFGNLTAPDNYYELRHMIDESMRRGIEVAKEADERFEELYGRSYGLCEEIHTEDADTILVTSGTVTSTARSVIDERREKGESIGMLKMRVFRPFPTDEVRRILGRAKKVVVLDRNIGFSIGGNWAQEIRSALYNSDLRVPIFSFIAGIGGRDVTPPVINEVLDIAAGRERPDQDVYWIGVRDDELSYTR